MTTSGRCCYIRNQVRYFLIHRYSVMYSHRWMPHSKKRLRSNAVRLLGLTMMVRPYPLSQWQRLLLALFKNAIPLAVAP